MKNILAALLTVTVFLNSGKVLVYKEGTNCTTSGGSSPLFGADSPDTVLDVWKHLPENDGKFAQHYVLLASFNLKSVEHWEVK
jgi:hypothetical protein